MHTDIKDVFIMLKEEEAREAAVRAELAKITKANPNAVPLYIILNSNKKEVPAEQPLTLCNKDSTVKDLLLKLHRKYPTFEQIYFFGKDHGPSSTERKEEKIEGKSKRKRWEKLSAEKERNRQEDAIIPIVKQMLEMSMEHAHNRYKDPQGLLVMIISDTPLLSQKRKSRYELILLAFTVLFAGIFLYVSFTEEQPKSGEEVDYLNII